MSLEITNWLLRLSADTALRLRSLPLKESNAAVGNRLRLPQAH